MWVRVGDPLWETGYTLAPNLLLDHYETLGLTEGTALFVIRLLRESSRQRSALADSPQTRKHLALLHERGLLRVRRWPDRIEFRLDGLWHNLRRLAEWLAQGHALADFEPQAAPAPTEQDRLLLDRFSSPEFEAEMADVLAAFAAANGRSASPTEKEHIRNLAMRFDAAACAAAEPSNGPAWIMAALRSVLERKAGEQIYVSDLEQALAGDREVAAGPEATDKAVRQRLMARIRQMTTQDKEALETVIMAYQQVAGQPAQDGPTLAMIELAETYGSTWVLNAIHETAKVQSLISPEYVASILMRWQSEGRIAGKAATAGPAPVIDPLLARVAALYEQEIGPLTPQTGEQLKALSEEFGEIDDWLRAFAEAARSNARNLRYVEAVLRKRGEKPATQKQTPSTSRRGRKGARAGVWTEEELEAARRKALNRTPLDPKTFFDEEP
ncbi:MAG: DnaD domain protein [Chloroflexota bacterium]